MSLLCFLCAVDTFYLGRLGGVAASAPLTKGFNGPLIFYQYSICLDVMRNKDYYWTWLRSFYRYFLKVSTRKLDLQGMLTI